MKSEIPDQTPRGGQAKNPHACAGEVRKTKTVVREL